MHAFNGKVLVVALTFFQVPSCRILSTKVARFLDKSRYNIQAYQGKTKRTGVESSSTQVQHGTTKNYLDIFHIDFILTLTSSHDLHVSFFHLAYHNFNDWSAASHFRSNLSSGHKSQPYQRSVGCFLHAESLISLKTNWLKKRLAMNHKLNITIYDQRKSLSMPFFCFVIQTCTLNSCKYWRINGRSITSILSLTNEFLGLVVDMKPKALPHGWEMGAIAITCCWNRVLTFLFPAWSTYNLHIDPVCSEWDWPFTQLESTWNKNLYRR